MVKILFKIPKGYAPAGHLYAKILVKFSVLGAHTPGDPGTDWREIWHGGVDGRLHAKYHPNRCNVSHKV